MAFWYDWLIAAGVSAEAASWCTAAVAFLCVWSIFGFVRCMFK